MNWDNMTSANYSPPKVGYQKGGEDKEWMIITNKSKITKWSWINLIKLIFFFVLKNIKTQLMKSYGES